VFSLLIHYYPGYTEEHILGLTPSQFADRLGDVFEIESMMKGEGKGRIKRNPEMIRQYINRKTGMKGPKIPE